MQASAGTSKGAGDSERAGRLESEARVVLRVADHDHQREVGLGRSLEGVGHERRARALSLVLGEDRHRGERQHLGAELAGGRG